MKVLVVVDMQNDFIDGALGTKEAVAIVPYVKEVIETFEGKVLLTLSSDAGVVSSPQLYSEVSGTFYPPASKESMNYCLPALNSVCQVCNMWFWL